MKKININKTLNIIAILFLIATISAEILNKSTLTIYLWVGFLLCFFTRVGLIVFKKKNPTYKLIKTLELKEAFEAGREYQEYKSNANLEEKSWEYTFDKWYERTYNYKK
jgi:hypothetical protein